MSSQNSEIKDNVSPSDNNTDSENQVAQGRRAALSKLAYGSPAVAALLLSVSPAAQASPANARPTFTPPPPPG